MFYEIKYLLIQTSLEFYKSSTVIHFINTTEMQIILKNKLKISSY